MAKWEWICFEVRKNFARCMPVIVASKSKREDNKLEVGFSTYQSDRGNFCHFNLQNIPCTRYRGQIIMLHGGQRAKVTRLHSGIIIFNVCFCYTA